MAPKAKTRAAGKAEGTKKESNKESSPSSVSSNFEAVLRKWSEAKAAAAAAEKEVEECKSQVEVEMRKQGTDTIKTAAFEVTKRKQSRESCSKKDLPADVWAQYAKVSEFTVLALKQFKG